VEVRKVREEGVSGEEANLVLNEFEAHINQRLFTRIPIDCEHYTVAFTWLTRFSPISMHPSIDIERTDSKNTAI